MRNLIAVLTCAVLCGCASFQVTSGKLLASSALSVDAAMKGWAQWVVAGQATTDQESAVKAAYQRYQVSMSLAQSAYTAAVATDDRTAFQRAADVLAANKQALVDLITSFQAPKYAPL